MREDSYVLEDDHGTTALTVFFDSVSYRGGSYHVPHHQAADGSLWWDVGELVRSQREQWNMRTHFDLLDVGDQ